MSQRFKLLIVDDEERFCQILKMELEETALYSVEIALDGIEAINKIQQTLYDLVLLDIRLPRVSGQEVLKFLREYSPTTPVIVITGNSDIPTAIESMKMGAYDFISKPYDIEQLLKGIERGLERKRLFIDNVVMKSELTRRSGTVEIIGTSPPIRQVIENATKVAESDSLVLIQGASGTGKELVANLIHRSSPRNDRPFVAVNCASIPDTLLESELFGYEKGAFTNAYATKQGLVEVAHGGTLFLDEVGDISPTIQPKLLRFLEAGNFRRVGGINELKVDVRILSATNKDLHEESKIGKFRQDLLYRLNVVTIRLPLLTERREDIPLLVEHFLKSKTKSKTSKTINPVALELLMQHDWPGNIRELEHVIEGAVIMSRNDVIEPTDLLLSPRASYGAVSSITGKTELPPMKVVDSPRGNGSLFSMEEMEKRHIESVLEYFKGGRAKTAQTLGISQKTLYLKIKRYGIRID